METKILDIIVESFLSHDQVDQNIVKAGKTKQKQKKPELLRKDIREKFELNR